MAARAARAARPSTRSSASRSTSPAPTSPTAAWSSPCDPLSSDRGRRARARAAARAAPRSSPSSPPTSPTSSRSPRACVKAGADGLTMINTLLGMVIDTDLLRPQLAGVTGGLSGPADPPGRRAGALAGHARRCARAGCRPAPLIGVGGVRTGRDALELVAAGRQRGPGRHRDLQRPVSAPVRVARRARGRGRPARASPVRRRRRHRPRRGRPARDDHHRPSARGCGPRWTQHGPFCAGIDPHRGAARAVGAAEYTVAGLERFAMTCVEAFAGTRGRRSSRSRRSSRCSGPRGIARPRAGPRRPARRRHPDAARRQARRHRLDDGRRTRRPTSPTTAPLRADAITVSPFLGYGSLRPALDLAAETGRGVFVLALTSNPEGPRCSTRSGGRDRWRRRSSRGGGGQRGAPRPGASSAASGWSSAPPSATRSTTSGSTWRRPTRRSWRRGSARRAGRSRRSGAPSGRAAAGAGQLQPRGARRRPGRGRPPSRRRGNGGPTPGRPALLTELRCLSGFLAPEPAKPTKHLKFSILLPAQHLVADAFGAEPVADQAGGQGSQRAEHGARNGALEPVRRVVDQLATAADRAVGGHLEALHHRGRGSPPPLHAPGRRRRALRRPTVWSAARAPEVGRRHGVLDRVVDPDAERRRHGVGRVADAQRSRHGPPPQQVDLDGQQLHGVPVGELVDDLRQRRRGSDDPLPERRQPGGLDALERRPWGSGRRTGGSPGAGW